MVKRSGIKGTSFSRAGSKLSVGGADLLASPSLYTVDKIEKMLGSYGPQADAHRRTIAEEESPSGMLARSGTYLVRSRIIDDDQTVWLDFEWTFKLTKEW